MSTSLCTATDAFLAAAELLSVAQELPLHSFDITTKRLPELGLISAGLIAHGTALPLEINFLTTVSGVVECTINVDLIVDNQIVTCSLRSDLDGNFVARVMDVGYITVEGKWVPQVEQAVAPSEISKKKIGSSIHSVVKRFHQRLIRVDLLQSKADTGRNG